MPLFFNFSENVINRSPKAIKLVRQSVCIRGKCFEYKNYFSFCWIKTEDKSRRVRASLFFILLIADFTTASRKTKISSRSETAQV